MRFPETREPRRLAQRRRGTGLVVIVGQVTIGIAGLAVLVAIACLLWDRTKAPFREVTFASAKDWPTISNGVPDLKPSEAPPDVPLATSAERPSTAAIEIPDSASPAASLITAPVTDAVPAVDRTPPVASSASATDPPGAQPDVPTAAEAVINASPDTLQSPGALPSAAVDDGNAVAAASETSADGQNASVIAPSSVTDARSGNAEVSAERDERAGALRSNRSGTDQRVRAPAALSSQTAKPRAATDKAEPERRKARLAESKRTRTAATQEQARPDLTTETSAVTQPAPDGERTRLLGIPLPTGREIKECLLQFRC
jgi:hypothetical protein